MNAPVSAPLLCPSPVLIGCSSSEATLCALETQNSIGGTGKESPGLFLLQEEQSWRKPRETLLPRQQQQQQQEGEENGTASSAARHEGLHSNCALTLQDAPLQLRRLLDTDRNKLVPSLCRNLTWAIEDSGLTGR